MRPTRRLIQITGRPETLAFLEYSGASILMIGCADPVQERFIRNQLADDGVSVRLDEVDEGFYLDWLSKAMRSMGYTLDEITNLRGVIDAAG